jgi:O-antigen ligase
MQNFLLPQQAVFSRKAITALTIFVFSAFLISTILFGQSLVFYIFVVLFAAGSILYEPVVGLFSIAVLTMWFERFFTLQELVVGITIYKIYPLDIVIGLTLFSLLLHKLYGQKFSWKFHRFDKPMLIFGAIITVMYAFTLLVASGDSALAFSTYKNYLLYGIVYVLSVLLLKKKEDWQEFIFWILIGGVGLFFFLLYGLTNGVGLWTEFTPLSTSGSRLIAGTHVFYFVIFGLALLGRLFWSKDSSDFKRWLKIGLVGVVLALAVSLVRHLWIALAALGMLWLVVLPKRERNIIVRFVLNLALVGTVLFTVYLLVYIMITGYAPTEVSQLNLVVSERLDFISSWRSGDTSIGWRLAAWGTALQLWKSSPIFGVGFGQQILGIYEITSFFVPVRELHNNYLGILLQTGLLGLSTVVYWFVYLLKTIQQLWKKYLGVFDSFYKEMTFIFGSLVVLFMMVFGISVYWDINLFIIWWWFSLAAIRFVVVDQT